MSKEQKTNYFNKLIKNNTGFSSKNFFLVIVTIIGCLLLCVPIFTLCIEAFFMHTITTDLTAMATYIAAVSAIFVSAGVTKVYGDKYENQSNNDEKDS